MEARHSKHFGGPPSGGRSSRPMRPAPYERPDRYGPRESYDSHPAPRERFSDRFGSGGGGGGMGGGRFKGERAVLINFYVLVR